MRISVLLLTLIVAIAFVGSAFAVPPGKSIEYSGGTQGKVVFDGKIHADKGNKCNDCHTKIFQMKKNTFKMSKEEHGNGKFCGACHDGKKAFAQDAANCAKCHSK